GEGWGRWREAGRGGGHAGGGEGQGEPRGEQGERGDVDGERRGAEGERGDGQGERRGAEGERGDGEDRRGGDEGDGGDGAGGDPLAQRGRGEGRAASGGQLPRGLELLTAGDRRERDAQHLTAGGVERAQGCPAAEVRGARGAGRGRERQRERHQAAKPGGPVHLHGFARRGAVAITRQLYSRAGGPSMVRALGRRMAHALCNALPATEVPDRLDPPLALGASARGPPVPAGRREARL